MIYRSVVVFSAVFIHCVIAVSLDAASPASESNLAELLRKATFRGIDDDAMESSRNQLLQILSNAPTGVGNEDWEYLRTESVSHALSSNSPDMQGRLDNLIDKLSQNFSPFENPHLLEMRRLLRRHSVMLADRSQRGQLRQLFDRVKISLEQALSDYEKTNSLEPHRRLASGIRWLELHGLADEFVRESKRQLSFPNLIVMMPASVVRRATSRPMPFRSEPIDRNSDGIHTLGHGEFSSSVFLEPSFDSRQGVFRLRFSGEMKLTAVNTRNRIQFRSSATTRVSAVTRIALDDQVSLTHSTPSVCASTDLCNGRVCVDRRLGKRVIGCLADRVVARKTPEIEVALSRELQERVQQEIGKEVTEMAAKANTVIRDKVWAPARRLDLTPRQLSIATTDLGFSFSATEDTLCGLASPSPFHSPNDGAGYAAIETSLATDLLNRLYVQTRQPRTLTVDMVQRLNDSLPVHPFTEVRIPDEVRVFFELDLPRPFRTEFDSGIVSLTVKARRIVVGDQHYSAHDLVLSYRVSVEQNGGIRLALNGQPVLTPQNASNGRTDQILMQAVNAELLADLKSEFLIDPQTIYGKDPQLNLYVSKIVSENGWLTAAVSNR
jgi:hypothetical protein